MAAASNPAAVPPATANFRPAIQAAVPAGDPTGPSTISCPAATDSTPSPSSATTTATV